MGKCIYMNKCSYVNSTIKHNKEFNDVFIANYCKYHYKKCAIWKIAHKLGAEKVPENLLPFELITAKGVLDQNYKFFDIIKDPKIL